MDLTFVSVLTISTFLCFTMAAFFLFKQVHSPPKTTTSITTPTVLKPYPIVGTIPHFIKNGHRLLDWITDLVTASPTGTVTVAPVVFTADPAVIEHLSRSHFSTYQKGQTQISGLHDFLGAGILHADGDTWRVQRKTASFEFNTRSIRAFVQDTVRGELDTRLLPLLAEAARTGKTLDLQDVLERFAFDNVCSLIFDHDPAVLGGAEDGLGERFYHAFEEAAHLSIQRSPYSWMWKLMRWLNIGSERRLRAALATVNNSIYKIMQERRTSTTTRSDLFSRFAATGKHSEVFLRDIMVSFVLAGRDTTPSALTWFFWVISTAPRVRECILQEIRSLRKRGVEGVLGLDELRGMQYLHSALTESMRLYPPVSLLPRECVEDDVLPDGTAVKKGWMVMYSAYAMGRMERVWGKGWAEFSPERWMEDGVFKLESSFRYPVFHAGPRVCLGKELAYIQMKAVAAALMERFEFEVVEKRGEKEVSTALKMVGGLPVRVKERNG